MTDYLFNKLLDLAQDFPNSPQISSALTQVSELVMVAEKIKNQECGYQVEDALDLISSLKLTLP